MRFAVMVGSLALALGCSQSSEDDRASAAPPAPAAKNATTAPPPTAAPGPGAAAPKAPCFRYVREVLSNLGHMENAADGAQSYPATVEAWQAVPERCRTAEWHLFAARILRYRAEPLAAGTTRYPGAEDALAAALALEPHPDVLVMVAFVSALGGQPRLPADACARAKQTTPAGAPDDERVKYVCAHAGDDALWSQLENLYQFPDLALRKAQALSRAGNKAEAKKLATQAAGLDRANARGFGATDREYDALIRAAQQLAR